MATVEISEQNKKELARLKKEKGHNQNFIADKAIEELLKKQEYK